MVNADVTAPEELGEPDVLQNILNMNGFQMVNNSFLLKPPDWDTNPGVYKDFFYKLNQMKSGASAALISIHATHQPCCYGNRVWRDVTASASPWSPEHLHICTFSALNIPKLSDSKHVVVTCWEMFSKPSFTRNISSQQSEVCFFAMWTFTTRCGWTDGKTGQTDWQQ